jgi:hypothetical protein
VYVGILSGEVVILLVDLTIFFFFRNRALARISLRGDEQYNATRKALSRITAL